MAHQEITEADMRARTRKLLEEAHPDKVDQFTFRGKQYDHGLAWVHFPEGFGGLGISPGMQAIVADELAKHAKTHYDDMMINAIGIGIAARGAYVYVTENFAHVFPAYSETEFRDAITAAFNRARRANGVAIG